jgi:hypothetical protein
MNQRLNILILAALFTAVITNAQDRKPVDLAPVKQTGPAGKVLSFEERRSVKRATKAPEEKIPSREQRKLVSTKKSKRKAVPVPVQK